MRKYAFTFKCNATERRMIAQLAKRHGSSKADVMRLLIRNAACEIVDKPSKLHLLFRRLWALFCLMVMWAVRLYQGQPLITITLVAATLPDSALIITCLCALLLLLAVWRQLPKQPRVNPKRPRCSARRRAQNAVTKHSARIKHRSAE